MDNDYTDDNPRTTELMDKIVGDDSEAPVVTNDMGEEMISKDAVDQYIQDKVNELYGNKVRMEKEAKVARLKAEEKVIAEYNDTMKSSDEPWVDLKGYTETANGLKISLDWNDAFIQHLRDNGMKGTDDEQIVHTWLAMLMKNVAAKTDDGKGDFED